MIKPEADKMDGLHMHVKWANEKAKESKDVKYRLSEAQ
jgi:hypothetical protein